MNLDDLSLLSDSEAAAGTSLGPYALFTLDGDGVIVSWNSGIRKLLGYEEHEFVGQNIAILYPPEDRASQSVERELSEARETGEAQHDHWLLRKDGARVWINCALHCLGDDHNGATQFVKILRRERAGDASSSVSMERFAEFVPVYRNRPTGIAILERDTSRIVDANEAFKRILGSESRQIIGCALSELGIELAEARSGSLCAELTRGETIFSEATFPHQGGEHGHALLLFEPVQLGGQPRTVMLINDVTEPRRVQRRLEQKRELISAILDSLPSIFYMMDASFPEGRRLVRWNAEFERVTGLDTETLAAATVDQVIVESEEFTDHVTAAFSTGGSSFEGHLHAGDGKLPPYLFTARRVMIAGQVSVLGIGKPIHEQLRVREVLERQLREQAAIADLSAATLSRSDFGAVLKLAAQRVAETLAADYVHIAKFAPEGGAVFTSFHSDGTPDAAALQQSSRFDALPQNLPSDDDGVWPQRVLDDIGMKSGIRAQINVRGQRFGFIEALSDRKEAFSSGDVSFLRSVTSILSGVIAEDRLRLELAHRADHDDLTGLLNRAAFEARLVEEIARAQRTGNQAALLFLDLDRFKRVNDAFGHQAGDAVLHQAAKRITSQVRSWDVVGRQGGDEFVLFLPDIDSNAEIGHFASRLLKAFEAPFTAADRELQVGVTIGIAIFPEDGEEAQTLLRAADTALYEGKLRGRNTIHFFTREQDDRVRERLNIEVGLRNALERSEFEVAYQPQVDLVDGAVRVVEALIRWQRPEHGEVLPGDFLPIAEEIGLAAPIGEWMLRRVFTDHAGWRNLPGAPVRVAVNVSLLHFLQPSFPTEFKKLLRQTGVSPTEVEIELDEQGLPQDPERMSEQLQALQELGVHFVLDGFGANASPLARLRSLPIERLKLDESFTRDVHDERGSKLTGAIVQVALALGVEPTAKGVETEAQHNYVLELGFRAAQGRWYAAPSSRDDLLAFLQAPHS